jgi:hypothetical protein
VLEGERGRLIAVDEEAGAGRGAVGEEDADAVAGRGRDGLEVDGGASRRERPVT